MRQLLTNLGYCTLGAFLLSVGVALFLSPNHIAAGGPAGIAIILYHTLGISKGLVVLGINIVLMAVGARLLGMGFLLRTVYAVAAQSLFIELLGLWARNSSITAAPLLNTLYGGSLVGIGLALIFKGEAASGGYTLVARLIAGRFRIGVGKVVLFLDLCVIAASGLAFGDIEAALWAGIGVYVTGVVIDLLLTGEPVSKVVHISTNQARELARQFDAHLQEDGSVVHCNTLDDSAGHELMLLVVDRGRVDKVISIVRNTDQNAHVVVMDAAEFLIGNGFSKAGFSKAAT